LAATLPRAAPDPAAAFNRSTGIEYLGMRHGHPIPADARASAARRQRGIALLSVLWGLVVLSAIAAGLTATARTDLRIARNAADAAMARALAEAGVARGVLAAVEASLGAGPRGMRAVPSVSPPAFGRSASVQIEAEAGKVDLNLAPRALLAELFVALGAERGRADALADAVAARRAGTAARPPAPLGRMGGTPAGPSGSFLAVEELAGTAGFTPGLYALVAPYVTVHSRLSVVDPAAAAAPVLAAAAAAPLPPSGGQADTTLRAGPASPPSLRTLTIRSDASTETGTRHAVEAVIDLTRKRTDPFRVLAWRQVDPVPDRGGASWTP
jgi:general secretion pathway protein K